MSTPSNLKLLQFAGVALLAIVVADVGVAADSLVLREEHTSFNVGKVLKGGKTVKLEKGAKVWLLDEAGNITKHEGPVVVRIAADQVKTAGIVDSFKEMLGVRKSSKRLGGVRGDEGQCPAAANAHDVAVLWRQKCKGQALAALDRMMD